MLTLLTALAVVIGLPLLIAEIALRLGHWDRRTVFTFACGVESITWGLFALSRRPGWLHGYFVVMGIWLVCMARWRWQSLRSVSTEASATRPPSA